MAKIIKTDGTYLELCEKKNDGFSNQTSALSLKSQPEDWRFISLKASVNACSFV